MKTPINNMRLKILRMGYRFALKPMLFRMDPEQVHDRFSALGQFLGAHAATRAMVRATCGYHHPMLEQIIAGVTFPRPIGLSAGFDKNARLCAIMPAVGFGFAEVGSITGEPCSGNPKPRLWRHPEQQSLRVYYGLKNDGAEAISARLRGQTFRIPVGVSIAKTNCAATVETDAAIADYVKAYGAFQGIGNYDTINISCPNAYGGQPFTDPQKLRMLLHAIQSVRNEKPLFLKLSPDLSKRQLLALLAVADEFGVDGVICSNLTKQHAFGKGGLSGKPVQQRALKHIHLVRKYYRDRFVIIAVGGIFTADDAYLCLRAGASLLQLITGMIYQGPQTVSEIHAGLVDRLTRDGFEHLSEAIGIDAV